MTQADSVLSTPPTNTPVDTTRRRFLAVAAVGSIIGAGSLAAAAIARQAKPSLTVGRYGLINRGEDIPAGVMRKRPSLISTQRRLFRLRRSTLAGLFATLASRFDFANVKTCAGTAGLPGPPQHQHAVRYTELAPDQFKNFWR